MGIVGSWLALWGLRALGRLARALLFDGDVLVVDGCAARAAAGFRDARAERFAGGLRALGEVVLDVVRAEERELGRDARREVDECVVSAGALLRRALLRLPRAPLLVRGGVPAVGALLGVRVRVAAARVRNRLRRRLRRALGPVVRLRRPRVLAPAQQSSEELEVLLPVRLRLPQEAEPVAVEAVEVPLLLHVATQLALRVLEADQNARLPVPVVLLRVLRHPLDLTQHALVHGARDVQEPRTRGLPTPEPALEKIALGSDKTGTKCGE